MKPYGAPIWLNVFPRCNYYHTLDKRDILKCYSLDKSYHLLYDHTCLKYGQSNICHDLWKQILEYFEEVFFALAKLASENDITDLWNHKTTVDDSSYHDEHKATPICINMLSLVQVNYC